jgi:CpeT/CpcT family (DUF1001)
MGEQTESCGRARADVVSLMGCMLCVGAGSLLVACAAQRQSKEHEVDLAQITRWLPGNYNNNAQHDSDVRAGKKPPHEALAISIVPIDSPIMGAHAFYLQEMAADDSRRVMLQQVLSFEQTGKDQIKESVATLVEPRRWRDAHLTPELLTAITLDDLTPMSGCDLFWKRNEVGFVAANDPRRCHSSDRMTDAAARNELRAELKSTELSLSEQSYDESGTLAAGRADEPFYRFHKSSEHKP